MYESYAVSLTHGSRWGCAWRAHWHINAGRVWGSPAVVSGLEKVCGTEECLYEGAGVSQCKLLDLGSDVCGQRCYTQVPLHQELRV